MDYDGTSIEVFFGIIKGAWSFSSPQLKEEEFKHAKHGIILGK